MSVDLRVEIPYVRQATERMCGAATLEMVYRSFGLECDQMTIWPDIQSKDLIGRLCSRTFDVARDAHRRGLSALIVKAKEPKRTLQRCLEHDLRVIVNHRMTAKSTGGHFSVLAGLEDDHVTLQDPLFGPDRRLPFAEFLPLWTSMTQGFQIGGGIIIAFSIPDPTPHHCVQCTTLIPESVPCPRCHEIVPIAPASVLGCIEPACAQRTWSVIFCPSCDQRINSVSADAAIRNVVDPIIYDRPGAVVLDRVKALIDFMQTFADTHAGAEGLQAIALQRLINHKEELQRAYDMMAEVIHTEVKLVPRYRERMALREWENEIRPVIEILEPEVTVSPEPATPPPDLTTVSSLRSELLNHLRSPRATARGARRSAETRRSAELETVTSE